MGRYPLETPCSAVQRSGNGGNGSISGSWRYGNRSMSAEVFRLVCQLGTRHRGVKPVAQCRSLLLRCMGFGRVLEAIRRGLLSTIVCVGFAVE